MMCSGNLDDFKCAFHGKHTDIKNEYEHINVNRKQYMIHNLKYVYNGIRYDKQKFVVHLSLKIDIVKAFLRLF